MSSILIQDLARHQALEKTAMAAVRGGGAMGPDVNVNVTLNQKIGQFQQIGINVLNGNGVIGAAGFAGAGFGEAADHWKENHATVVPL